MGGARRAYSQRPGDAGRENKREDRIKERMRREGVYFREFRIMVLARSMTEVSRLAR